MFSNRRLPLPNKRSARGLSRKNNVATQTTNTYEKDDRNYGHCDANEERERNKTGEDVHNNDYAVNNGFCEDAISINAAPTEDNNNHVDAPLPT